MYAFIRELFPICRSITGDGLRATLRALQRLAPLTIHEVPTGTRAFDWTVPREWNVNAARIVGPTGEVVVDFARSNLHLVGYSVPFRGRLPLAELQRHLHSIPEQPSLVPFRTNFFGEDWGFCLSHERRLALPPGDYDVLVDTRLEPGSLSFGELLIPGRSEAEVLVSAHCCHPSMANDNLSGVAVAVELARRLQPLSLRYSYRFLFAPGTFGALAWLALNEARVGRIAHGLVLACLGDEAGFTYKKSRRGEAEIDRATVHVLAHSGEEHVIREFEPWGDDERQYGSPGFDLPVGALCRTPYGERPECHTSGDDLGTVTAERLAASLRRCLDVFELLEGNLTYVNTNPRGEPRLGARGLILGSPFADGEAAARQRALLWALNLSDGARSLLDIAERSRLAFALLREAADRLEAAGLLRAC